MGYMQINRELNNEQINNILRFLTTLADEERTTATPLKDQKKGAAWTPPNMRDIPKGEAGDLIRYGAALLNDTHQHLGPKVENEAMRFSGNVLSCANCHQDNGTKQFGLPWMGASQAYPQYRGREDEVQSLEQRINGCFERSLNGKAVPVDSKEMRAMVVYIDWLSKDMTKETYGLGTPRFEGPNRKGDVARGEQRYALFCMSCHGGNGEGYQVVTLPESSSYVAPPLWGDGSYNVGAGMNRLLTTAAFIQSNMPLGTAWNKPALANEDVYDIAAYLSSKERPAMAGLEKDYPKLEKKPVDCPYPPYADSFSQEQHQYGPFQPIQAAREAAKKEQKSQQ